MIVDEPEERAEQHLRRLNLIPPANSLPVAGQGRRAKVIQITPQVSVAQVVARVRDWLQPVERPAVTPEVSGASPVAIPSQPESRVGQREKQGVEVQPEVTRPVRGSRESLDPWLDSLVDHLDNLDL